MIALLCIYYRLYDLKKSVQLIVTYPGKVRIEELAKVVERVIEEKQVSTGMENAREDVSGSTEENFVEDTGKRSEESINGNAQEKVLGMIEIDTIDVKYPIIEGVGQDELRYAIGHVSSTAGIGENENCVLAGHRGSRYGKFFKRLRLGR